MISPARVAALDILTDISTARADLPTAISRARESLRDDRDRALAGEIALGVQRWRAALDHLIVGCSERPIDRIDAQVVDILRLSAYQLLHLSRVPASAVVDDAVNLARRARKASAGGFVNAVLREISRRRKALPLPARPAGPDREAELDYLSITLSHPRWLAARWLGRFGFETAERWMQFDNHPAPLTIRANPRLVDPSALASRLQEEGVKVHQGRFAPGALIVESGNAMRSVAVAHGLFVVQDEASQLVALAAGRRPGLRVLDVCASPGGKALAVGSTLGEGGWLVACDVRPRRMELLRRTVAIARARDIRLVRADLLDPAPFEARFDTVIVDAPCSGLGTLRRDPDIRWTRGESDLERLAANELRILVNAAGAVRPGGRLLYATCSSEPEENDGVVAAFLRTRCDFTPVDLRAADTSLPRTVIDSGGRLRTSPHEHGLEAFFAALLERRTGD
jgi:16S rRNA (cytosine967-C5)-methyltransferase